MKQTYILWIYILLLICPFLVLFPPIRAIADCDPAISPPIIHGPIYVGAEVVGYRSGTAGYTIEVFANQETESLGKTTVSQVGWGTIRLHQAVEIKGVIWARQSHNGKVGCATWEEDRVTVKEVPSWRLEQNERLKSPSIQKPLWDCQRGAWVENLVEGAKVIPKVDNPTMQIEEVQTPYKSSFVTTPTLEGFSFDQTLSAKQQLPPVKDSLYSQPPTTVTLKPKDLSEAAYKPIIMEDSDNDGSLDISIGTTLIKVCKLIVGATVEIHLFDENTNKHNVDKHIALGTCTLFPVKPLTKGKLWVVQKLCDKTSPSSVEVNSEAKIGTPEIVDPLCAGMKKVKVKMTEPGAIIEIMVNGKESGGVTAGDGVVEIPIGGERSLQTGDEVQARQINGTPPGSPWTIEKEVLGLDSPSCTKVDLAVTKLEPKLLEKIDENTGIVEITAVLENIGKQENLNDGYFRIWQGIDAQYHGFDNAAPGSKITFKAHDLQPGEKRTITVLVTPLYGEKNYRCNYWSSNLHQQVTCSDEPDYCPQIGAEIEYTYASGETQPPVHDMNFGNNHKDINNSAICDLLKK